MIKHRMAFEAQIDQQNQSTFRSHPQAIGVQIARLGQDNPHEPSVRVGLKAIMRDGREHIFVNLNGSNLLTLVLEEDGAVTERRDIPT